MSEREFSVVEFYDNGKHAYVERWLDAKAAVMLSKRCVDAADALNTFVNKIIITDGGDYTVFEWQRGKGVTFPAKEKPDGAQRRSP